MIDTFNGKLAVVTGGGTGMGRELVRQLSAAGCDVAMCDVNADNMAETATLVADDGSTNTLSSHGCDVSDEAQVRAFQAEVATQHDTDRIDVLFNNAGTLRPGSAVELSVEDWDLVMGVNVRSIFLGAKFAVPHMEANGGGSIINTASISGLHGDGGAVVYAASKGAVINLTRALSTDHAPQGVRVNAICPGTIETPPVQRMMADPNALELNKRAHALGRLGRPEEIANAALWLASDESSFVSGEAIVVDGGLRAQSPLGRIGDPRPAGLR